METENHNAPQPAASPAPQSALRERVLDEIRKMAAENGGRAPGAVIFNRKTGFTHALWNGELWARWGDAVQEAGLARNIRKPRMDDEKLLEQLAAAIRLFGRMPTYPELLLHRKSGAVLPRHGTLSKHFGAKHTLIRRLKSWAQQSPGRADVAGILAGVDDSPPMKIRANAARPLTVNITGAVYLLRSGDTYKLGCTRSPDPARRIKRISDLLPKSARLVHAIGTDDPFGIENYWHRRFAEKRWRGEWFTLSQDDLAAFRSRKVM